MREPLSKHRETAALIIFLVIASNTHAQDDPPKFEFPLKGVTAYTVSISGVLDHSQAGSFCRENNPATLNKETLSYTGERGTIEAAENPTLPCGAKSHLNTGRTSFLVNGKYVFGNELSYDGHSGYDFDEDDAIIVAPATGEVYLPKRDLITGNSDENSWCEDHTFYIDHGNGWSTWYLHSEDLLEPYKGEIPEDFCSSVPSANTHLGNAKALADVAQVGGFSMGSPTGIPEHLHFEVRQCEILKGKKNCPHCVEPDLECNCIDVNKCKTVDPYGWEWIEEDPLSDNQSASIIPGNPILWNGFNRPQISTVDSVWNAEKSSWDMTISGSGFSPGALFAVWDETGYWNGTGVQQKVVSDSLITGSISKLQDKTNLKNIGALFVKVKLPDGPRSLPYPLNGKDQPDDSPIVIEEPEPQDASPPDCDFKDVVSSTWSKNYIRALCKERIMTGDKPELDGESRSVRPSDPISRAEFVKLLVETLDRQRGINAQLEKEVQSAPFSDVQPENEGVAWFIRHVEYAKENGLIDGGNEKFFPARNIIRAEAAKILLEAFELIPDKEIEGGGATGNNESSFADIKKKYEKATTECSRPEDPICSRVTALFPGVHKEEFTDVSDPTVWYYYYIYGVREASVMTGKTDENGNPTGLFDPSGLLLRGEAAKILCLTFFDADTCSEAAK